MFALIISQHAERKIDNTTEGPGVEIATVEPSQSNRPGWFRAIFRRSSHAYQPIPDSRVKPRKVPIKVEPKVFFANERTFLSWLRMSVVLASISIAIVAFAEVNPYSLVYGLCMQPVAIGFCVYSLWMYIKRATMIRKKEPGPCKLLRVNVTMDLVAQHCLYRYTDETKAGPVVLAVLLGLVITVSFCTKLYYYATH